MINGAVDCNVFWQVGSSATLGTATALKGNVLALTSITLTTGATVSGRVLARNAAVTMDTNGVLVPSCATSADAGTDAGGNVGDAGADAAPSADGGHDAGSVADSGIPDGGVSEGDGALNGDACDGADVPPPPIDAGDIDACDGGAN
jgi:hypothetical protein